MHEPQEDPGMFETWYEFAVFGEKMLVASTLMLAGGFGFVWLVWAAIGE